MNRLFRPATLPVLAIVTLSAGCGGKGDDGQPSVRKTPVTVAEATREPLQAVETTVGRLEATAMPALAAETSGRVVRLHVDGGSVVKRGQVLAELDGEPQRLAVASARASVERLEALLGEPVAHREALRGTPLQGRLRKHARGSDCPAERARGGAERRAGPPGRGRIPARPHADPQSGGRDRRATADFGRRLRLARHADRYDRRRGPIARRAAVPRTTRGPVAHRARRDAGPASPTRCIADGDDRRGAPHGRHEQPRPGGAGRPASGLRTGRPAAPSRPASCSLRARAWSCRPRASCAGRPAKWCTSWRATRSPSARCLSGCATVEKAEILGGVEPGETVVVSGAGFLTDGALVTVRAAD